MYRLFLPLLLLSPWAMPLPAQDSGEAGKKILAEAFAALGGPKFMGMQDRLETGRAYSFYNEQLAGLTVARFYTRYLVRPEPPVPAFFGIRERQVMGKGDSYYYLFNETGSYEVTYRGAKPLPEDTANRYRESTLHNIFYILRMRMGEPGLDIQSKGKDVFDNQPVDIVEIADNDNRQILVYFHTSTRLPVRQVYYRRDPKTRDRLEEVTLFSKYRDVNGIQWPFAVRRERNGQKIYEMFAESVVFNQGLSDDVFSLPATVKIIEGPASSQIQKKK